MKRECLLSVEVYSTRLITRSVMATLASGAASAHRYTAIRVFAYQHLRWYSFIWSAFGVRDNCQLVRRGPFPLWDNSLEVVTEAVPGALSEWHCWEIRRVLPCRCILVFKLSGAGRFAENEENWMTFLRSFHLVEDVCPAALWEAQPVVHIDTKSDRQPDLDVSEGQEWVAHLPANLTYLLPVFESLSCNVEDELHSGDSDLDPLTDAIAKEIKGLKFSAATELVRNHRDLLTEFLNEPDVPDRVKDIGFHIVGALLRESWIVKHIQSGER